MQNWIGGNDYNPCGADVVPPPPEHVEGLLADLCTAAGSQHGVQRDRCNRAVTGSMFVAGP